MCQGRWERERRRAEEIEAKRKIRQLGTKSASQMLVNNNNTVQDLHCNELQLHLMWVKYKSWESIERTLVYRVPKTIAMSARVCLHKIENEKKILVLQLLASPVPRPLPLFNVEHWKPGVQHWKTGSGLGTRLTPCNIWGKSIKCCMSNCGHKNLQFIILYMHRYYKYSRQPLIQLL